jgi:hypothetical protein
MQAGGLHGLSLNILPEAKTERLASWGAFNQMQPIAGSWGVESLSFLQLEEYSSLLPTAKPF